ncbi:HAD-IA family hydrolase [Aquimarina sp. 2201CG1-2-11]|uniref:HAD-IA family hydrolase n=1 Tax=Aquimarina discodermiae TaxID=3231043 RepID=UPI0034623753
MSINKKIELAVFDMAGTTVNEDNVVYKTVRQVINEEGFNVTLDEVLEHGAGKEKYQAIIDILTHVTDCKNPEEIAKKAFVNFKPMLERVYKEQNIAPFDHVHDVFKQLRKNKVYVVLNTGYDSNIANQLISKLKWEKGVDYDALLTADDVIEGRPHKEMICKAMQMFDIEDASKVMKIGDSAIDIEEGKNASCGLTIGVLTGAQTREQIEKQNPDYILDDLSMLTQIVF